MKMTENSEVCEIQAPVGSGAQTKRHEKSKFP